MTGAARGLGLEVVSPELALVDPELGETARARLADPGESAARARLLSAVSTSNDVALAWSARPVMAPPQRDSRRVLFSVAAVTMLALLLFDVRVEVGERPAAAEPEVAGHVRGGPTVSSPGTSPPARDTGRQSSGRGPGNSSRKFAWAPSPGASGYHVEFFRGARRVFSAETSVPSLTVPTRWTFGGRRQSFRAGEYGWYVWPIVDGHRRSTAVVQTTLTMSDP